MTADALTVSQVVSRLREIVVAGFPSAVWVRGEVSGFRRTTNGAVFFRLVDPEATGTSLEVSARGRVMVEVDRALAGAGLGGLRDGVEVRVRGTIGVEERRTVVRLALIEVDPTFTIGRLAIDRAEVLRRMSADGSLHANRSLPLPLVPLRIGLVTSRGSAAHADFLDQLRLSGYRFAVRTVHTAVQGEGAADRIAAALGGLGSGVDMVAVVRGGGSPLDLVVFDGETVARAIAAAGAPVITGIGHDIDRTVADEAAAVSVKTPSAAGEWLVDRVRDYAGRIEIARRSIGDEAKSAIRRHHQTLQTSAAAVSGASTTLARQGDALDRLRSQIAESGQRVVERHTGLIETLSAWFDAIDVDATLRRGFAVVTREDDSRVLRSVVGVSPGDRLVVRLSDGTVRVTVDE